MNVLITGIMGQVGLNLAHYFSNKQNTIFGSHHKSISPIFQSKYLNLSDDTFRGQQSFNDIPLDVIIHCAALTDVNLAQSHAELSMKINFKGTQQLLSLAKNKNIPFIYLSTDFVFNGNCGGYHENSLPEPISHYGKSKLYAEQSIASYDKSIILRFTPIGHFHKLQHHNNSLVDWIINSSKNRQKIHLFQDKTFSPITSYQIYENILNLLQQERYGLFHITSEENSIYSAGRMIEEVFNLRPIVQASRFPSNDYAKIRPKYSHLTSKKLLPYKLKSILQHLKLQRGL
ncbi:sugar nucleotide-binding protein [bacterium]|nr:sugar nucleotide-binding protein [bacterium]